MLKQARCFRQFDEQDSCMKTAGVSLEIRDLRLVQAIAADGSLARASLRLHLTPSALSHHLLALESRIGAQVFQRAGRTMRLTPAGARLAEASTRVLDALADAERVVGGAESFQEVMRLATECHTTYYWLPAVLAAFERSLPHVEVRLAPDTGARPLAELLAGQVDVAIVNNRVKDRRVRYFPILNDELVALVAPSHPWAARRFVAAADFAGEHLIHYAATRSELTIFRDVLRPAGIQPRRVTQVLLTEAILEMVRSGLGVAVLAHWAAAAYVERGQVRAVRITRPGLRRQWCLAVLATAARTPAVQHLVEALRGPGVFKVKARGR
jgi:LysR family transcriptional regulator, regulator for metE and metH